MRILNLYAGIGGNRKLWQGHDVTAVELDPHIAEVYKDSFPGDTVIVGDAHQYLLDYYNAFDFVWSSPVCKTHSRARYWSSKGGMYDPVYVDFTLYQEVIFLKHFFNGKWVVENVKPYYDQKFINHTFRIGRHLFWSNFSVSYLDIKDEGDHQTKTEIERNAVNPLIGKHIIECSNQTLFSNVGE